MKKRILSLLLVLILLLSQISINVFALNEESADAYISLEHIYAELGSTVTLNINIDENPGIAGATLIVSYDSGLTLTEAVNGEAFSDFDFSHTLGLPNPCNLTWDSESGEVNKNGTIAVLTFEISESVKIYDKLSVSISYRYGDVYSENEDLTLEISNGSIMALNYVPGDVFEDKVVNPKDTKFIRQYVAGGYGIELNEDAADVNDDNVINTKDTRLIRQHIAGGYGVTLLPHTPRCQHTSLTAIPAKEASCTVDGNIAYWKCNLCSKYFSNVQATKEVSISDVVIKASGHTYSTEQWSADENEHWHTAICEHTDERKDVAQHIFDNDVCTICSYDKSEDTKITVTFVDYDSSVLSTQKISSGESAVEPSSPTRTNYAFVGWDKSFENLITDTVIKAQYIQQFTVTFKDYDGTVLKAQKVNKGQSATPPASPSSVEGYHFKQWNGSYNNVNSTTTVTATYEINMYNVQFVYPDGTLIKEEEVGYGHSAVAPTVEEMYVSWSEKKAYFFNSWDTDYSQVKNNMVVTADYSIPVNEPVIAVYAENGHNLTQGTVASTVYLYFLGDISMYGLDLQFSYDENLKISSEDKIKYSDLFENAATKLVDRNKNYQLTWVADTKKEISGFLEIMSIEFSFPALMESGKYFIDISDDTYIVNEKLERVVPIIIPGYISFK